MKTVCKMRHHKNSSLVAKLIKVLMSRGFMCIIFMDVVEPND